MLSTIASSLGPKDNTEVNCQFAKVSYPMYDPKSANT